MGELILTTQQAYRLAVSSYRQISPHLENCCLRISANVSYSQIAKDVAYLTGIQVPAKPQQRLVHQQRFPVPQAHEALPEVSVDGGKVQIRTPIGQSCQWKNYKTLATDAGIIAAYHNNALRIDWTHQQPLVSPVTCLGDGQDGIWNIVSQMSIPEQRREILDW